MSVLSIKRMASGHTTGEREVMDVNEAIELESLVGLHELSGVSFDTIPPEQPLGSSYGDANRCTFIIDGVAYQAIEDPDDGYRSSLDCLLKCSAADVTNTFTPIKVLGAMRGGNADVIDFADVRNGKVILSVGTENTDDYYPWFEATWTPENIAQ